MLNMNHDDFLRLHISSNFLSTFAISTNTSSHMNNNDDNFPTELKEQFDGFCRYINFQGKKSILTRPTIGQPERLWWERLCEHLCIETMLSWLWLLLLMQPLSKNHIGCTSMTSILLMLTCYISPLHPVYLFTVVLSYLSPLC